MLTGFQPAWSESFKNVDSALPRFQRFVTIFRIAYVARQITQHSALQNIIRYLDFLLRLREVQHHHCRFAIRRSLQVSKAVLIPFIHHFKLTMHENAARDISHLDVLLPEIPSTALVVALIFDIEAFPAVLVNTHPAFAICIGESGMLATGPLDRRTPIVTTEFQIASTSNLPGFETGLFAVLCGGDLPLAIDVVLSTWVTEIIATPVLGHIRHRDLLPLVNELRAGECRLQQTEELGCPDVILFDWSGVALNTTTLIVANFGC